jgi:hypothetical protein
MVEKAQQTGSTVGQRQDSIVAGRLTIAFSSQFDWNKTANEFDIISHCSNLLLYFPSTFLPNEFMDICANAGG